MFLILAVVHGGLRDSPLHRSGAPMEPWRLASAGPLCLATIVFASRGRADRGRARSLLAAAAIPLCFDIVLPACAGLFYLLQPRHSQAENAFEALLAVVVFAWLTLMGSLFQLMREPTSPQAQRWAEGSGVALTLAAIAGGLLGWLAKVPAGGPNVLKTAALVLALGSGMTAARIRTLEAAIPTRVKGAFRYCLGAGAAWLLADVWLVLSHLGGLAFDNHRIAEAGLIDLPIVYIPGVLFSAALAETLRLAAPTPPPPTP